MNYHGVRGNATLQIGAADQVTDLSGWTLDLETDEVDVTQLGAGANPVYRKAIAGPTKWSGTLEGFLDSGNLIPETSINMTFKDVTLVHTDGTTTWTATGEVIVTNLSIMNDRNDAARYTCNFSGAGDLTWFSAA